MEKVVYEIDGKSFSTLEGFYDEVSKVLIPGADWGRNFDAFNDILRGGFGTPENGFVIRWKNSEISRKRLGYRETIRVLKRSLSRCDSTSREYLSGEMQKAKAQIGSTVFDWICEIILKHCPGGEEAEDGVELVLH
jgi:RNAse (barnase) inhibitor barstar